MADFKWRVSLVKHLILCLQKLFISFFFFFIIFFLSFFLSFFFFFFGVQPGIPSQWVCVILWMHVWGKVTKERLGYYRRQGCWYQYDITRECPVRGVGYSRAFRPCKWRAWRFHGDACLCVVLSFLSMVQFILYPLLITLSVGIAVLVIGW